jgi:telomeric repeat-binding factor 2-interacting protein 1
MTRPVGAPRVPARGSRVQYTTEDDQILWDWMQPYEARKDQIAGNLIYQQLALQVCAFRKKKKRSDLASLIAIQHPRHTFQSWRDHYLKRVRGNPRPGGPAAATEPDSPEQESSQRNVSQASSSGHHHSTSFTPASQDIAASKRKRQSYEGPSTVPSYEVDHEAKRRRRATDFIPRNDPSTPVQTHDAPVSRAQSTSQNAISDASQSENYETAPQFPLPTGETQTQLASLTPSQLEEEENFKAVMELPFPAATRPQDMTTTAGREDEGIEEWIQERIENGQSGDHVLLALSCTSMDAELADKVLVLLSSGQNIPSDIPGVWTEQDDKDLLGADARAITRLNEKHGAELFQKRYDHLKNSAEATRLVAQEGV